MKAVDEIRDFYDARVDETETRARRYSYYREQIKRTVSAAAGDARSILLLGCGTGDLLAELAPERGVGIDLAPKMVARAAAKHPRYRFVAGDTATVELEETFDLIVAANLVGELEDIWSFLRHIRRFAHSRTRLVIIYYNYLWEPILKAGEAIGLRAPQPRQNWLPVPDIENILRLNSWDPLRAGHRCLLPLGVPLLAPLVNRWLAPLPLFRRAGLISFVVARPAPEETRSREEYTVTVVIPCRNEAGNIEELVQRTPRMGRHTEILFIDGASEDGTPEEIRRIMARYRGEKDVKLIEQGGALGKKDAVWKAFDAAEGEILMILDADITVAPEDLPKFYLALAERRCEFVNGSRLVYAVEPGAMRSLNFLANHLFARAFSFVLSARIRDTLCGTKVLFRNDWPRIRAKTVGSNDPFGDFDLLLGAAELGLKIGEIPVRYRERVYGETKIRRFRHGWLLFKRLFRSAHSNLFV
jgi:SAM-dependent methyltransferase